MKLIYLAIPYSGMEESSFEQANLATVLLMKLGYNVISPITHCHSLTKVEGFDLPGTWEFWQKIDYQLIDKCDEIFVLIPEEGMEKVDNSTGVQAEMKYAKETNKTVTMVDIQVLKWNLEMQNAEGSEVRLSDIR
jgi:hypothetical protein